MGDCSFLTPQPASLRLSHGPTLPALTRCGVGNSPARALCTPARAHAAMATRNRPLRSHPPAFAGLTILSLELPCRKLGLMAKGLHPHHHSDSPIALSPQTLPLCHFQFPGQGHRVFQIHVLRRRGPLESGNQRRGSRWLSQWHCHSCPGHPQALVTAFPDYHLEI